MLRRRASPGTEKEHPQSIRNCLPSIQVGANFIIEQDIGDGTGRRVENKNLGGTLKDRISQGVLAAILLFSLAAGGSRLCAQESPATPPANEQDKSANTAATSAPDPPAPKAPDGATSAKPDSPQPKIEPGDSGQQTKRILWIIPNYRSVSANTYLPPQSFKEKFWMATQDSFDYSAFVYVGILSGAGLAGNSEPSFGHGASGYGNYFAHGFADNTIENYMVEAIVPSLTKEDPRYYTLGKGGFFKRSGYAVSRLFITRTDSGKRTFNLSETVGAGAAAGIGNAYYPANSNEWVKTYQRWLSQVVQDGVGNMFKEFWPDVNKALFRHKG
jgi:hypothetical protein